MRITRTLAIFNAIALLIHIGFSYLSQSRVLSNNNVGEVSGQYESLFTPAGFTFGIWGIIYISLTAFTIFHIAMAYRHPVNHLPNRQIRRVGVFFILNNLSAAAWLWCWTNERIGWSVILIVAQLLTLVIINVRLSIYDPYKPISSRVFTQFPLSIYFGWLTIATIANLASYLVAIDWNPGTIGAGNWTRILIAAAVLIGSLVIFTRRNVFYGLVLVWALYGIIMKRQQGDDPFDADIIRAAWIGMGLLTIIIVIQWTRNISYKRTRRSMPVASMVE